MTRRAHVLERGADANPTAGPWKTMKVRGKTGASIEIHRFGIFEQRPDLVLLSPSLLQMLVIEAKDTVRKLASEKQIQKAKDDVLFERPLYSINKGIVLGFYSRKKSRILV